MYRYDDGVWCDDGERIIRARVVELLQDRYRMSHGSTVIDMLRTREPLISEDKHDTTYLNLPNGLLEWRTGQLHPHDPTIPSVNRIPIEWDPDATCPEIEAWIGEVFPDDTREFVEEVIGYCLLNDNPLHKAILLYGKGRNGKGTLLRLLTALIGQRNISSVTPQSLDENRFRAAELFGKLANLVGDVDPKIFTATETFKQITGGDRITAERKYGQPFSFTCRALMIAAFNALPRSSDTSEGFFSRWIVVPFTGYFPPGVADPGREDKMHTQEELRGLLVLAVRGLARVMGRRRFDLPETVEKETARFRRVADPVRAFLDDWLPELLTEFVPRRTLYTDYTKWCEESGYNPMAAHGFFERVEAAGNNVPSHVIAPRKRSGTRGYVFIKKEAGDGAVGAVGADTTTPGHAYGEKNVGPAPSAPGSAYAFGWDEET